MKSVNALIDYLKKHGEAGEIRGNPIRRHFADTGRYMVDFATDFTAEGWKQYDTDQDAAFFGVWVNPSQRLTLCYAEGDWEVVSCPTVAAYNAELAIMGEFYGEGRIALVIDGATGAATEYRQDRAEFVAGEGSTV